MDGVDLTDQGPTLAARGEIAPVPVLVGSVSEDINRGGMNCQPDKCTEGDFRQWAGNKEKGWGFNSSEVERIVRLYSDEQPKAGGNHTKWAWAEAHAGADQWGGCPARRLARWVTRASSRSDRS